MADPWRRATSSAPPTLGEGCTARYDPAALSEDDGTTFPGAAQLWNALAQAGEHSELAEDGEPTPVKAEPAEATAGKTGPDGLTPGAAP
jgi:hypothetical protein